MRMEKYLIGLLVTSSIEIGEGLTNIIHEYEDRGIDVVPISELKEVIANGMEKALKEESLTSKLLGETNGN